jgi:hypothetical protein
MTRVNVRPTAADKHRERDRRAYDANDRAGSALPHLGRR